MKFFLPVALALAVLPTRLSGQDSLRLGALHASAVQHDPRARQLELLSAQSKLRQLNLDAERKTQLTVESQAQYQSDVARIPIALPGGQTVPSPSKDTYDAHVAAQQRLYDPTLASRRAVEDARLAESEARTRVSLFGVRQQVNDAYFAALRTQSQESEITLGIRDLEEQLRVARARVLEGTALPSDTLALLAEVLRRRQSVAELVASRRATLDVLADLTGVAIDSVALLETPDLAGAVADTRARLGDVRARAEYEQFARARESLAKQAESLSAQDLPRVSAFGRLGYGRPGLNPLSNKFGDYWLAGVQLQWAPFTWGTTSRNREVLELQRESLAADERYFTASVRRGVAQDLASIARLAAISVGDDDILLLREQIAAEMRARYAEGVVTSAQYIEKETDVASARVSRALHRVELAQARAHFLTTLGIEVR
jgi:outer membrane protein TolC